MTALATLARDGFAIPKYLSHALFQSLTDTASRAADNLQRPGHEVMVTAARSRRPVKVGSEELLAQTPASFLTRLSTLLARLLFKTHQQNTI